MNKRELGVSGGSVMLRWNWKRWAFAIVTGSALTGAFAAAGDLPKSGESITLKSPGQPDRVVSVVKSVRKADGSVETQVKDAKTGDTFSLVDPAPENKIPSKPVVSGVPQPLPPLPKSPSASAEPPAGQVVGAGDKRLIGGGKLFNREPQGGPATIPHTPAAAAATPVAPVAEEKRPGMIGRLFGKKPTPAPIANAPAMPPPAPVPTFAPPPPVSAPTTVPMPLPTPIRTNEPPRIQPMKPVAPPAAPGRVEKIVPPTPVVPQVSAPSAPGAIPVPSSSVRESSSAIPTPPPPPAKPTMPPVAAPTIPSLPPIAAPVKPTTPVPVAAPTIPSLPVAPVPLPTIPPAPISKAPVSPAVAVKPANAPEVVKPVVHAPVQTPAEVETLAKALKDTLAPSARLKAAKELATGPHASSKAVHTALFTAAKTDPCPEVKADCITHLSMLGDRDPSFVAFVKSACSDESSEVRLAAKTALAKLK
jgi:hypothetical protein